MKTSLTLAQSLVTTTAIALLGCSTSFASVLISQSESAPTENLLYQLAEETSKLNWNGYANSSSGWRDVGQTFKAQSNATLEAFSLKLHSYGTQALNANFTIEVYETSSGATTFTSPNAKLISTQHGSFPNLLQEEQYLTFTLDETISLTADKFYTIFLHFDEHGSTSTSGALRQMIFARTTVDSNSPLGSVNANFWLRASPFSTASRQPGEALSIRLYGTTAIPEASTTVYLIGSLTLVAACRYRKQKRK